MALAGVLPRLGVSSILCLLLGCSEGNEGGISGTGAGGAAGVGGAGGTSSGGAAGTGGGGTTGGAGGSGGDCGPLPRPTSVGDPLQHGQSVDVIGCGFGTKDPVAPYAWLDMEAGTAGAPVDDGDCGSGGLYSMTSHPGSEPAYESLARGVSHIAVRHRFDESSPAYNSTTGFCELYSRKLYASYWGRVTYTTEALSRNFKLFNGSAASSPYAEPSYPQFRWDVYPENGAGHFYSDTGSECGASLLNDWAASDPFQGPHQGEWRRFERYSDDADGSADGAAYLWIDGELAAENLGQLTGGGASCGTHWGNLRIMGYYARDFLTANPCPAGDCSDPGAVRRCETDDHHYICRAGTWVDVGTSAPAVAADVFSDEYYVDRTPARVEICEGGSWANRGRCEIQLPTAWSDTSLSVSVNRGALGATATAFLYVVNDQNEANVQGLAVVFADSP